jgi:hypothetical protein
VTRLQLGTRTPCAHPCARAPRPRVGSRQSYERYFSRVGSPMATEERADTQARSVLVSHRAVISSRCPTFRLAVPRDSWNSLAASISTIRNGKSLFGQRNWQSVPPSRLTVPWDGTGRDSLGHSSRSGSTANPAASSPAWFLRVTTLLYSMPANAARGGRRLRTCDRGPTSRVEVRYRGELSRLVRTRLDLLPRPNYCVCR